MMNNLGHPNPRLSHPPTNDFPPHVGSSSSTSSEFFVDTSFNPSHVPSPSSPPSDPEELFERFDVPQDLNTQDFSWIFEDSSHETEPEPAPPVAIPFTEPTSISSTDDRQTSSLASSEPSERARGISSSSSTYSLQDDRYIASSSSSSQHLPDDPPCSSFVPPSPNESDPFLQTQRMLTNEYPAAAAPVAISHQPAVLSQFNVLPQIPVGSSNESNLPSSSSISPDTLKYVLYKYYDRDPKPIHPDPSPDRVKAWLTASRANFSVPTPDQPFYVLHIYGSFRNELLERHVLHHQIVEKFLISPIPELPRSTELLPKLPAGRCFFCSQPKQSEVYKPLDDFRAGVHYPIFLEKVVHFLLGPVTVMMQITRYKEFTPLDNFLCYVNLPSPVQSSIQYTKKKSPPETITGCFIPNLWIPPHFSTQRYRCTLIVETATSRWQSPQLSIQPSERKRAHGSMSEPPSQRARLGDLAYCHPVINDIQIPRPGDVISIGSFGIRWNTSRGHITVVPQPGAPWLILMSPLTQEEAECSVQTAYVGETYVKVEPYSELDKDKVYYVVPSGKHDGFAIVKNSDELTQEDRYFGQVIRQGTPEANIVQDGSHCIRIRCLEPPPVIAAQSNVSKRNKIFGDMPWLAPEKCISRSDDASAAIWAHVFSNRQANAGPSSSSSTAPKVTVIFGQTGAGKSILAQQLFLEAATPKSQLFDYVGFFDVCKRKKKDVHLTFFNHFSAKKSEKFHSFAPIASIISNYRMFLVIDDCRDWDIVKQLPSLHFSSQIIVTTQAIEEDFRFQSFAQFELMGMPFDDGVKLLKSHSSEISEALQKEILAYAGGHPLLIDVLGGILGEPDGAHEIMVLLSQGNPDALYKTKFDKAIKLALRRVHSKKNIETDLFCSLIYFRKWETLPYAFVVKYWNSLVAQLKDIQWSEGHSRRLLTALHKRRLISISDKSYPLLWGNSYCRMLYPNPFAIVSLHDSVWDYCTLHHSKIFQGVNVQALVSELLWAQTLDGTFNFLLINQLEEQHPNSLDGKLARISDDDIIQINTGALECPKTGPVQPTSEPVRTFVNRMLQRSQHTFDMKYFILFCLKFMTHRKDLPIIGQWFLKCLRVHELELSTLNSKQRELLPWPLSYCNCVFWANFGIGRILSLSQRFPTECASFIRDAQIFLEELLGHPKLYSSPAVSLLGTFATSPEFLKLILTNLDAHPTAIEQLYQNPDALELKKVFRYLPYDAPLPRCFEEIIKLLLINSFVWHGYHVPSKFQHGISPFTEFESVWKIMKSALESHQSHYLFILDILDKQMEMHPAWRKPILRNLAQLNTGCDDVPNQ
jgi:hypothetical protein